MKPVPIRRGRQHNHLGTIILITVVLVVLLYALVQFAPLYLRAVALGI